MKPTSRISAQATPFQGRRHTEDRRELEDGMIRCYVCDTPAFLHKQSKKLRAHRTPSGEYCSNRVVLLDTHLEAVPPVDFSDSPTSLAATGHCHTCDKLISGERRYCGTCLAQRSPGH